VRAEAYIARLADGRYQLALKLQGKDLAAERSLSAAGCEAATQAAALLIAMAIDPSLSTRRGTAALQPPPSPTPDTKAEEPKKATAPPPEPAPESATTQPEQHASPVIGVGLGALADLGALPGLGVGIAGEVELPLSKLRLSVGFGVLPESARSVPAISGASVDMGLAIGIVRACVPWTTGRFELGPCLAGEAGSIHGQVHGIALPHSGAALWLGVAASARARLELGSGWGVVVDPGLVVPHARRMFLVLTDSGTLTAHRVAPVTFRIGVGLAYQFQ